MCLLRICVFTIYVGCVFGDLIVFLGCPWSPALSKSMTIHVCHYIILYYIILYYIYISNILLHIYYISFYDISLHSLFLIDFQDP